MNRGKEDSQTYFVISDATVIRIMLDVFIHSSILNSEGYIIEKKN